MSTSWLPPDYTPPDAGGKYFKPKSGTSRVRILAAPILGNVGWRQNGSARQPVRKPMGVEFKPGEVDVDAKNKIRHFWALPVWNYEAQAVQVWEITQVTIQGKLHLLSKDPNWGVPMRYDVTIHRTGESMDTEYEVTPAPPRKPAAEIVAEWAAVKVAGFDLNRLFAGGDPFDASSASAGNGTDFDPAAWGDDPDDPGPGDEDINADPFA